MGTSASLPDAPVSVVTPAVRLFLCDIMARPIKNTVEYFPHFVKAGRTIFILESRFGNDGYAFWFKLLEILGESEGHFYDCADASSWAYLLSKTRVGEEQAEEIISLLINLGKIDADLWRGHRVIWVDNFTAHLGELYRKRKLETPTKPDFQTEKSEQAEVSGAETLNKVEFPQDKPDKEKERKEKKSKENAPYGAKENSPCGADASSEAPSLPSLPYGKIADLWNDICTAYPRCVKVTDRRKTKIRLRLAEMGCGAADEEKTLKAVGDLFRRMQASSFLRGDNGRGWQASFDWLFENGSNWVKVTEGNYDDRGGGHRPEQAAGQQPQSRHGASPDTACPQTPSRLGVGEFFDETGRRTYGTGKATIPDEAPPRPSERYYWNASTQQWLLL